MPVLKTDANIPKGSLPAASDGSFYDDFTLVDRRKSPRARISLIIDSPTTRNSIWKQIENTGFRIITEYQDLGEIEDPASLRRRSDIFILGLDLQSTRGVDTIQRAREMFPNKKILVYLYEQDVQLALECYLAGAIGVYFERYAQLDSFRACLQSIILGNLFIQRSLDGLIDPEMLETERRKRQIESRLSSTEIKILMLLRKGLNHKQIADRLSMTGPSVGTKISTIKKKLAITEQVIWRMVIDYYLFDGNPPDSF